MRAIDTDSCEIYMYAKISLLRMLFVFCTKKRSKSKAVTRQASFISLSHFSLSLSLTFFAHSFYLYVILRIALVCISFDTWKTIYGAKKLYFGNRSTVYNLSTGKQ